MRTSLVAALAAACFLAGCGGGGSSSGSVSTIPVPSASSSAGLSTQAASELAVTDTNAVGSPLSSFSSANNSIAPASIGRQTLSVGNGTCTNNSEFFVPDTNGDPHSTELKQFYDTACTQLARDVVRVFTSTGANAETITRTVTDYAANNSTPIAVRTSTDAIGNASFDANGYPIAASGFERVDSSSTSIGTVKTIGSQNELVMLPGTSASTTFCGDGADYNATGFAKLNETFGSQGVLSNGTRTLNADGTVTWTSTHANTGEKGAIGALSIAVGTANTTCPIVTPDFTLAGGTVTGSSTIPISATYKGGTLVNLTIANATLANGSTLNVTTNAGVAPSSNQYITGTIANAGVTTATFGTDAFGNGTLTMSATGDQYVITDWHVIK